MYISTRHRLSNSVRRKRPEKWCTNIWFMLHDNAPAHRSVLVKNVFAKNNVTRVGYPLILLTWMQLIFNFYTN